MRVVEEMTKDGVRCRCKKKGRKKRKRNNLKIEEKEREKSKGKKVNGERKRLNRHRRLWPGVVLHKVLPSVPKVEIDALALGVIGVRLLRRRKVPHLFRERRRVVLEVVWGDGRVRRSSAGGVALGESVWVWTVYGRCLVYARRRAGGGVGRW